MTISQDDRERISTAIHAAEAKTSGEIVCVLARTSSDATALPIFIAAVISLALPWLLVVTTAMPVFPNIVAANCRISCRHRGPLYAPGSRRPRPTRRPVAPSPIVPR